MGSGTYLGGSTVVSNGWTWSGKSGLARPKKKKQTTKHRDSIKISFRKLSKLSDIELNFLHLVIDSELNNSVITKINKKTLHELGGKIEKKGGIEQWAQSQPQYNELKNIKIKRKAKKVAKQKPNWIKNDKINIKELTLLNARRRSLLSKIAKSNNTKDVKLSGKERRSFINEINQKGGLVKWAEYQSQYKGIINRLKDQK